LKTKFVEQVKGDRVQFASAARQGELLRSQVSVAGCEVVGGLLAQLSDQQCRTPFRAGNFQPDENSDANPGGAGPDSSSG